MKTMPWIRGKLVTCGGFGWGGVAFGVIHIPQETQAEAGLGGTGSNHHRHLPQQRSLQWSRCSSQDWTTEIFWWSVGEDCGRIFG